MCIDLCRPYILMPQQELYSLQVRSPLKQCSGEAMTKGMGTDGLLDACCLGSFLNKDKDGDARDRFTNTTKEDIVLLTTLSFGAVRMS